jgi:hypothetical protein
LSIHRISKSWCIKLQWHLRNTDVCLPYIPSKHWLIRKKDSRIKCTLVLLSEPKSDPALFCALHFHPQRSCPIGMIATIGSSKQGRRNCPGGSPDTSETSLFPTDETINSPSKSLETTALWSWDLITTNTPPGDIDIEIKPF